MSAQKDFVPVVLGADALGYAYSREFFKHYNKKILLLSSVRINYNTRSRFSDYLVVDRIDEEEVLVKWLKDNIGRFEGKTPIVFCGSGDWRLRTLSKHKEELTALGYVIPVIDFPLLDSISQKDIFYSYCSKLGVPFPRTKVYGFKGYKLETELPGLENISSEEEIKALKYPLIAKPSNSADWHFANIPDQQKIYRIESADQLLKVIADLHKSSYSHALLLQELLSESDESLHTITTFSDRDGNLLVGVTGDVVLQSHTPTGIGNPLVILGRGGDKRLLDYAAKLLKEFKYEGYANFDVMDGEDGEPRFLEVNTRPGRNTYYFSLAGCPFVKPFVEYYINGDHTLSALSDEERRADRHFLFSMVSRETALQWAHGENLKEIKERFDSGNWGNPLFCVEDSFWQRRCAKSYIARTEKSFI